MGLLAAQLSKTFVTDDVVRTEVLKLGCIGTRVGSQGDELQSFVQHPIVVGGNIRDEVGGLIFAHIPCANSHLRLFSRGYPATKVIHDGAALGKSPFDALCSRRDGVPNQSLEFVH